MNKRCIYLYLSLVCLFLAIWLNPNNNNSTFRKEIPNNIIEIDTVKLFKKMGLPNRMEQFIQYLNQHQIPISNNFELLLLLSNPNTRHQLHLQLPIDSAILLMHAELADLTQIQISEIDAQVLYFSQRNYQNLFNGKTMNLQILSQANAERLLQDIGGWLAGNRDEKLKNYSISIEEIESWIFQAKLIK